MVKVAKKMEGEKREKHEEVMQIKKDLINFAHTTWGKEWIKSILNSLDIFNM